MEKEHHGLERFNAFSDCIFGVIITILVLDLRPPTTPTFKALLSLWPMWLSYAVSYLLIAIVWVNHHYLLRYAEVTSHRLIWTNFAHLFAVSLVPFSTAWIADSRLAAFPVALYAADFVLINATYIALSWEVVERPRGAGAPLEIGRMMRVRAFSTLGVFALASIVSFKWPTVGMVLICCCLLLYVRPESPGIKRKVTTKRHE